MVRLKVAKIPKIHMQFKKLTTETVAIDLSRLAYFFNCLLGMIAIFVILPTEDELVSVEIHISRIKWLSFVSLLLLNFKYGGDAACVYICFFHT